MGKVGPSGLGIRTVLIVSGGDQVYRSPTRGRLQIVGISDVDELLPETVRTRRLNLTMDLELLLDTLKQQRDGGNLSAFDCVLNLVSEPDRSPKTLEALGLLLRGYRGRVINRPEVVLRTSRVTVANVLRGIPGLLVPGAVRFRGGDPDAALAAVAGAGLRFPLIVRQTATHQGRTMVVVEDEVQFRQAVADDHEYFAIEFVDYRAADGLFRKYRIWSFGGHQVFRHVAIAGQWNVHIAEGDAVMFERDELIEEEVRLLDRPDGAFPDLVHTIVAAIGDRLGLDCFGVDFGFHPDGRMILFEANASMTFFPLVLHPKFQHRERMLAPAKEAFMRMLSSPG